MEHTQAKEIITLLSKEFKVRPPKLEMIRGKRSWYRSRKKLISFGVGWENHFTRENVLLHEFAHHLEYCRNGGQLADKKSAHSAYFVKCLIEVVEYYYGDLSKYAWDKEYKQVQRFYYRKHPKTYVEVCRNHIAACPEIERLLSFN